ncbi:MAG TPA: hypothetical protein VK509_01130 [Polyangiales bacterium]|nr:hypothetical protein [Polyangiales bacterium]
MMKQVRSNLSALLLCASALICASCESTTKVGSECKDGVCPRATSVTQQTCLVSSFRAQIYVVNLDDGSDPQRHYICVGRSLPLDEHGQVACEVRWSLGSGSEQPPSSAPKRCSDAPFLEPAEESADDVCAVTQLAADQLAAGDEGWYYDNSMEECHGNGAGIRFTAGAQPPTGTTIEMNCSRAHATDSDGELVNVDPVECERTESETLDIGAACLPAAIPTGGFDPREASVEVRSDQCESEACLVFALEGNPSPDCEASDSVKCPTAEEIERTVYCSCRCDAPEGDPGPLCDCVDGFSCVETIAKGPPGIRGSYCVRNESFSQ